MLLMGTFGVRALFVKQSYDKIEYRYVKSHFKVVFTHIIMQ